MWIDTHCHLYLSQFDNDRKEVVERAMTAGMQKMIIPNVDVSTLQSLRDCISEFPAVCIPAMGMHPCSVKADFKKELETILSKFDETKYCAVGEIGLDYYWDKTFIKEQKETFRMQAALAIQKNLPVIIHTRNSIEDMIVLVKEFPDLRGVFHCYSGNVKQAQELVSLGYYLGIGGVVTFNNSGLQDVVKAIPTESFLIETDAPYLAPMPYRGQRNEPSYIPLIARKIAEIKNVSFEELEEISTASAIKLFNINLT
ncbi:MAG: TatD family hydrolase [Bacteroidota bacterium]